jgi:TolC family type I secretion outer membrane protein
MGGALLWQAKRRATLATGVASFALSVYLLAGNAAWAVDLNEALALAYIGNPTLDSARAQLRATDELVPQALSGWRPTVTAQVTAGHEWFANKSKPGPGEVRADVDPNRSFWPRTYDVTVTQPVFSGFGTVSGTSRAENQVEAGRAQLVDAEQQILLLAVQAYMNVVRDKAVLDLNINNEKVIAAQLQATKDRFEAGEVTKTDVAQAESRLQQAHADRTGAEGQLTSSKATYRQIIGQEPTDLSMPDSQVNLPETVEATVIQSQGSPQVVAAQFNEKAAKDNIDVNFADLLPDVSLQGSFRRNDEASDDRQASNDGTVLGVLTIPLYQAGAPDSRVREAKQLYQQSRKQLDQARRAAEREAVDAWQSLDTTRAQITSFEEQVKAADVALDGVRQEQQVGARTVLDVLDQEIEALNAKVSLVQAQTDNEVAKYRVLAAIGRLTAKDLALNAPLYDATEHYHEVRNKFWGTGPSVE